MVHRVISEYNRKHGVIFQGLGRKISYLVLISYASVQNLLSSRLLSKNLKIKV